MAGGRKRIPSETKRLKGTSRKDRENPNEPDPAFARPEAPSYLTGDEAKYFEVIVDRLAAESRESSSHTELIALLAQRLNEIDHAAFVIGRDGTTYETETASGDTMIRSHPAVAQRSEALRHAHSLLAELGLTPASVSKVGGPKAAAKPGNGFLELMS